jgi:hypothetical protein
MARPRAKNYVEQEVTRIRSALESQAVWVPRSQVDALLTIALALAEVGTELRKLRELTERELKKSDPGDSSAATISRYTP